MDPKLDASNIWESAAGEGIAKYERGTIEHGGGFWTAGAAWYAAQATDESLDMIAYLHHLRERLNQIRVVASMLREDELTPHAAASLIDELVGNHPPKSLREQSHD